MEDKKGGDKRSESFQTSTDLTLEQIPTQVGISELSGSVVDNNIQQ